VNQPAQAESANKEVILHDVRLDWFDVYEPKAIPGIQMEPRYGATLIFPPTHPGANDIANAIRHVAVVKWGKDADAILAAIKAKGNMPLQDGAKKRSPYYDGQLFVSAYRSQKKGPPLVIGQARQVIKPTDTVDRLYRGARVNAKVEVYAWKHRTGGEQVNIGLVTLQFFRDADAFAGGTPPSADGMPDVSVPASAGAAPSSLDGLI
jgi:hypothetical protein